MKKEIPITDLSNKPILGVDEVGRGSLAGPVFVARVLCPKNFPVFTKFTLEDTFFNQFPDFSIVRDSKKLGQINREKIAGLIEKSELEYFLLQASSEMIDKYGIGVCISHMLAVIVDLAKQSNSNFSTIADGQIKLLDELSSTVLNDLVKCNPSLSSATILNATGIQLGLENYTIYRQNYADDVYLSVALASNLAKVKRDLLMDELDKVNPEYHWAKNKGYGTLEHRRAIKTHPKHSQLRYTFLKKLFAANSLE